MKSQEFNLFDAWILGWMLGLVLCAFLRVHDGGEMFAMAFACSFIVPGLLSVVRDNRRECRRRDNERNEGPK